jgi:hypothetical protein
MPAAPLAGEPRITRRDVRRCRELSLYPPVESIAIELGLTHIANRRSFPPTTAHDERSITRVMIASVRQGWRTEAFSFWRQVAGRDT